MLKLLKPRVASINTEPQGVLVPLTSPGEADAQQQTCHRLATDPIYAQPYQPLQAVLAANHIDALLLFEEQDQDTPAQDSILGGASPATVTTYLTAILFAADGHRLWSGYIESAGTLPQPAFLHPGKPQIEATQDAAAKWLTSQIAP